MKKVVRVNEEDIERLVRKIISEEIIEENFFNKKNLILTEQQLNETLLNEGWKDILLSIALLTGINLGSAQTQKAKESLSKEDIRNKIESTLQDTTKLNAITKNLSPEVKDKILKNVDFALDNLEKRTSKIITTTAKDEKELQQKIKQGYVPVEVSHTPPLKIKDTIITYDTDLVMDLNSDGLFKTGGYELSEMGVKAIQNIKDSIKNVGGDVESVYITSSTDKEPIKMGNEKLAELRAESVSKYFGDVNVDVKTLPNQGPDVFKKGMSENERLKARQETASHRYVKIVVKATYQDTTSGISIEKTIEKNTYELVKIIKKGGGSTLIRIPPIKFKPRIKGKQKCPKGSVNCPVFGRKRYNF